MSKNTPILSRLDELLDRIDHLEHSLADLKSQLGRPDPEIMSWSEAACLLGLDHTQNPPRAAKARVERERAKPDGLRIRTTYGGVNRRDFEQFLKVTQSKNPGAGERAQKNVEAIERRRSQ